MITFMYKKNMYKDFIAITNSKLYGDDFLGNVKRIAALHPYALILREKELSDLEYLQLARDVKQICEENGVLFFLHQRIELAAELECENIHLPYNTFVNELNRIKKFQRISVACHSLDEAMVCERDNATQIVLGTIFETECKKGLKGKGLDFVGEVASSCSLPIYAIGGIKESNIQAVKEAGATGGCMMSGFLK